MTTETLSCLSILACPRDGLELVQSDRLLRCSKGHQFPIVQGVPVLLRDDVSQTLNAGAISLRAAWADVEGKNGDPLFIETLAIADHEKDGVRRALSQPSHAVDPVISFLVAATNGILYKHLVGSLTEPPIPTLPLPEGGGRSLLDAGCSWGRWSMAAARQGYRPTGIDPSLGAVLAAKRLAARLSVPFIGVVGDARFLPFQTGAFDAVFSYSVLQHFSKPDARASFEELRRVLRAEGRAVIQMASAFGVRSMQHQARRRFREPVEFDVRYWTPGELLRVFRATFGEADMQADCYFGLGLQPSDAHLMPPAKRAVIRCSNALKRLSAVMTPLVYIADSVYLRSSK